jgi:UPF0755 protein
VNRTARAVVALGVLLAGAAALSLFVSYRGFERETFVVLERGAGSAAMARTLAQAGVIRYPWQFWMVRAMHPGAKLQAGEYLFREPATPSNVFRRIARGDVYYLEFTVPEGANMFDIAHSLEAAGAMPAEAFLNAAADPASIRDLDPEAQTLEGYLFPATYRLSHLTTAAELCRQMTALFRREWKKLAAGGTAEAHRAVTLASLVEKETGLAEERRIIAGVFSNRLRKGMLLQCDPTTIYAALLENRYRGEIRRSDLASHSAYNTYRNPGLPPGPIANPGAEAIAAALHPAETEYLYFVAKPSGAGHQFSTSEAAHERAVRQYRNGSKNARRTARKTA